MRFLRQGDVRNWGRRTPWRDAADAAVLAFTSCSLLSNLLGNVRAIFFSHTHQLSLICTYAFRHLLLLFLLRLL